MKEIAKTLGVTEARVCQIHAQAIANLRPADAAPFQGRVRVRQSLGPAINGAQRPLRAAEPVEPPPLYVISMLPSPPLPSYTYPRMYEGVTGRPPLGTDRSRFLARAVTPYSI